MTYLRDHPRGRARSPLDDIHLASPREANWESGAIDTEGALHADSFKAVRDLTAPEVESEISAIVCRGSHAELHRLSRLALGRALSRLSRAAATFSSPFLSPSPRNPFLGAAVTSGDFEPVALYRLFNQISLAIY